MQTKNAGKFVSSVNEDAYYAGLFHRLDRFIDAIVLRKRDEMFARIFDAGGLRLEAVSNVLDVGSTKDTQFLSSNFFARKLSQSARITLFSDQPIDPDRDLDFAVEKVLVGDATQINPTIGRYDLVMSSATIEHVGNADNQRRMIDSCIYVARKFVVITTPNRWHPIEFHTRLPLLHWLPPRLYRWVLARIGLTFFADEGNLNLLDQAAMRKLIDETVQRNRIKSWRLEKIRLLGVVSNLIFVLELEP